MLSASPAGTIAIPCQAPRARKVSNASSASLLIATGRQCDLELGEPIWSGGGEHICRNHGHLVEEQLARTLEGEPWLRLLHRPPANFDYRVEDIEILDDTPQAHIAAPIAV